MSIYAVHTEQHSGAHSSSHEFSFRALLFSLGRCMMKRTNCWCVYLSQWGYSGWVDCMSNERWAPMPNPLQYIRLIGGGIPGRPVQW